MADIISFRGDPHHSVEMLLPWYATGQLDGPDTALVEAHLGSCAHCRAALDFERRLKTEVALLPLQSDSGWKRLQHRLSSGRRTRAKRQRPFRWWEKISWPTALAAFAGAQMLLVLSVLLLRPFAPSADYRTLGAPHPQARGNIIVMFRPETTEQELRFALNRAGAQLIDGPTAAGAYVLAIEPGRREAALTSLRGQQGVMLAQPIEPGPQP